MAEGNHWQHPTSTPGRPETNGVAERAVRTVVEGARTALEHAGLPPRWWCSAGRHFCMASNIAVINDNSSWQRRHGNGAFSGLRILFGCLIDFKPSPTKGKATPKFAPKAVPGIFLGYHLLPGGRWRGDYEVAELSGFKCKVGEQSSKVGIQRVKEIYFDKEAGYIFPLKPMYEKRRRSVTLDADASSLELPDPEVEEVQLASADPGDALGDGGEAVPQAEGNLMLDSAKQGGSLPSQKAALPLPGVF